MKLTPRRPWSGPHVVTDQPMTHPSSHRPRLLPRCPACRREFVWQGNPHRPFCSLTCRLIDLGVWLDEGYRIAGEQVPTDPTSDKHVPHGGG